jgi:hypothetical protein
MGLTFSGVQPPNPGTYRVPTLARIAGMGIPGVFALCSLLLPGAGHYASAEFRWNPLKSGRAVSQCRFKSPTARASL